jgi:hypothetical protein
VKASSVVVFLGPSLPRAEARAVLDAQYEPPARMGDVYASLVAGVETIVLVDGLFHGAPSVWHREILDAITEGITVIGASSMGALRAAELEAFGMIGRGRVFEWYRDGLIDGDDEVALLHASEEGSFRPLSEPLVNMRATLALAEGDGRLSPPETEELIAWAKRLYYPHRSYERLLASPPCRSLGPDRVAGLRDFISSRRVDVKRADALEALAYAGNAASKRSAVGATPRSVFWELGRALRAAFPGPDGVRTGQRILEDARRDPDLLARMWPELSRRRLVLEWARQSGVRAEAAWVEGFEREWRARHGVDEAWLRANGLTPALFRRLLEERALAAWVAQDGGAERLVEDWARGNGVRAPVNGAGLARWAIDRGPDAFGIPWSFDLALLRELQVTGRAAAFAVGA